MRIKDKLCGGYLQSERGEDNLLKKRARPAKPYQKGKLILIMFFIMNKSFIFVGAVVMASLLSSCAVSSVAPVVGSIYTDVKAPLAVTSNTGASKVGTAYAESILGIIATGDASIEAAARQGGIQSIRHVDYKATSILGLYAKYTVYVYGE